MLTHKKPRPGSLDDAEAAKRSRYRRSRVPTVLGQLLRARPYTLLLLAASLVALGMWQFLRPAPFPAAQHLGGGEVPDTQLRAMGERTAQRYIGYHNMGLAAVPKNAYMPLDVAAAKQSCAATGRPEAGPMVVLATGTGGFVGSATALVLKQRGHGVLGLDNFNDYYPVALKRARQAHLVAAGVYTVDGDINDTELLVKLFDICKFTHVLHLAAQAGVRYAAKNPFSYVHANIGGQVALFETIKALNPMPAVVYASSSSVYGLNTKQPFSETDPVEKPASLYASTKRADELIAHTYHNIYSMSVTGLRFFTVYGPWGRPDMAAFKFAQNIVMERNITIFQGPEQSELSRDFTYVDDIVEGVIASLTHIPPSKPGSAQYKIYNLGNTNPHTVSELVELLEKCLDRKARRFYRPVPPTGDVLSTFADITAAKQDLGYSPKVPLAEGVQRFCKWFISYYDIRDGKPANIADFNYNPL